MRFAWQRSNRLPIPPPPFSISMLAKYILGGLAVIFLVLGATRGWRHPQGRTWLLVGAIFAVVSGWLFQSGR